MMMRLKYGLCLSLVCVGVLSAQPLPDNPGRPPATNPERISKREAKRRFLEVKGKYYKTCRGLEYSAIADPIKEKFADDAHKEFDAFLSYYSGKVPAGALDDFFSKIENELVTKLANARAPAGGYTNVDASDINKACETHLQLLIAAEKGNPGCVLKENDFALIALQVRPCWQEFLNSNRRTRISDSELESCKQKIEQKFREEVYRRSYSGNSWFGWLWSSHARRQKAGE